MNVTQEWLEAMNLTGPILTYQGDEWRIEARFTPTRIEFWSVGDNEQLRGAVAMPENIEDALLVLKAGGIEPDIRDRVLWDWAHLTVREFINAWGTTVEGQALLATLKT